MRHFDWRNLDSCQMSLMLCSLSFKHEMTTSFTFFPKKKITKIHWNHQLSCHTLFTLLLALFSLLFFFCCFFIILGILHLSIICLHDYQSSDNNKCSVVIVKSVSLFFFLIFFGFCKHKKCWQHLTFDSSLFSVQKFVKHLFHPSIHPSV